MDIEPFKILKSSITNGDVDIANSNEIDNIHELFQENTRNILNISDLKRLEFKFDNVGRK